MLFKSTHIANICLVFLFYLLIHGTFTNNARAADRLYQSDLSYLGAFALPSKDAFSPYTLAFNPNGNGGNGSLYTSDSNSAVEIAIPDPVCTELSGNTCIKQKTAKELKYNYKAQPLVPGTSTTSSLNPVDITGGQLASMNLAHGTASTPVRLAGLAYIPPQGAHTNARLYWGLFRYYNADNWNYNNVGYSDPDFGNPVGPAHIGDKSQPYNRQHAMKTAGYLLVADKAWADTYAEGKYLLSGVARDNGAMCSGQGPQLFASSPWDWTAGSDIPVKILMTHYGSQDSDPSAVKDSTSSAGAFTTSSPNYTPSDKWGGAAWVSVGSKQAVIFSVLKGTTPGCYGNGIVTFALSSLTSSGTIATAIVANSNEGNGNVGFLTGDSVTISGASPDAYNGTFAITATGANTFTYKLLSSTSSPATGTIKFTDSNLYGRQIPGSGFNYCYDPCNSTSEGFHNYPYKTMLEFYGVDDLTKAAQSKEDVYQKISTAGSSTFAPYPYLQIDLTPYLYPEWTNGVCYIPPTGIAYDSLRNRLYVVQSAAYNGEGGDIPVVHVFQVGGSSSSSSPTSPTGLHLSQ